MQINDRGPALIVSSFKTVQLECKDGMYELLMEETMMNV